MKTLKEYIAESKKVYSFKIKVAGDLPESFQENLKQSLERCKVIKLEKIKSTPIQALPLDFPTMKNVEVHMFEVMCEYPITAPEISSDLKAMQAEMAKLKAELRRTTEERDILKKAAAYFAKQSE